MLINYAELGRALAMPQSTLKRYMALLGMTFLVQPLPAWFTNFGKRLTKAPKPMLADTGLATHLIDADAERLKRDRTLLGHLLENFVATERTKQLGWSKRRCKLFHFRTDTGAEADFVLEDRMGRLVGVEVKCTRAVKKKDFRGLEVLAKLTGERFVRGVVPYPGATAVPFGKNLHALPMPQLWMQGWFGERTAPTGDAAGPVVFATPESDFTREERSEPQHGTTVCAGDDAERPSKVVRYDHKPHLSRLQESAEGLA